VTPFRPTSPTRAAAVADAPAAARAATLVETILAGVTYREVTVPRTEIKGSMRLLRRAEETQIRIAIRRVFKEAGIELGPDAEAYPEYRELWRLHFIATAVRKPEDTAQPLMPVGDWEQCDDLQLLELWSAYQDFEAEFDPLGPNPPPLTDEEAGLIRAAAKKRRSRPADVLRLTQAGALRDFYGRGPGDLTDTEVMTWWWAWQGADRQLERAGRPRVPGLFINAEVEPPK
jgi:hypothetical protein